MDLVFKVNALHMLGAFLVSQILEPHQPDGGVRFLPSALLASWFRGHIGHILPSFLCKG